MNGRVDTDKGSDAEEALRRYFLSMGAFVVRGVPVRQGGELISDIDLWVYSRSSAYAREIAIVDIKNKKRSRGFERMLWTKGLQAAVAANQAIVATTDTRDALAPFAKKLDVKLLGGPQLRAIISRFASDGSRINSEELHQQWRQVRIDSESLQSRMEAAYARIADGISFPALNTWVDESVEFFVLAQEREQSRPGPLTRAAYFCAALSAMAADYLNRDLAFSEAEDRRKNFQQGLLFGASGETMGRDFIGFAESAVTEMLDPSGASAATIRKRLEEKIRSLPVSGLSEFFTRPSIGRELLDGAIALEGAAFASSGTDPRALRSEAKAVIGAILDYGGLSRAAILGGRSDADASVTKRTLFPMDDERSDKDKRKRS